MKGKGKRGAVKPTGNYTLDVTEEANCTIKSLYRARFPISAPKYKDLKRLSFRIFISSLECKCT